MPLPDINLDDRRFEDIVAEARRRIPGYTPEWTDLNDSDPGMTLVQLFAWLSEMIIWRLNQVPAKNFIKFMELIGLELRPAAAAHVDLTFKLSAKNLGRVTIPSGTRVALGESVEGGPVHFETDDNLEAVSAEIVAVQSFDGAQYELLTESNRRETKYFYPFGPRPQRNAALYLGFDEPFPPGRHRLTVYAYTQDLIEEGQAMGQPSAATPPPVIAQWEYWAGPAEKWRPLEIVEDRTASLTRTGAVIFDAPPERSMQTTQIGLLKKDEDPPLFWFRYRIDQVLGSGYEIVPRLEEVLLNTIAATSATTVRNELLGASDSRPDQRFRLANRPILPGTLRLEVMERVDDEFRPWTEVADFSASGPDDRHFVLAAATGEVLFGSGARGMIPPILVETPRAGSELTPASRISNIRATRYQWGGGANANAGAGKITSLESAIPFVDSVTNRRPAVGGDDEETVDEAKERAPMLLRSGSRAVTGEDFEFLARQTPGGRIRRAKAIQLRHPSLEPTRPAGGGLPATALPVPGVVTVIVVPDSKDAKPMPREETLTLVWQWLDRHRLVTSEVFVAAPRYRKVEIEARVIAQPNADSGVVQRDLTARLLNYFHPLRGGSDGKGYPFGRTIFFSEIYRQIFTAPGVLRLEANALTTYVDGIRQKPCEDIPLDLDELTWSETHRISVSYE